MPFDNWFVPDHSHITDRDVQLKYLQAKLGRKKKANSDVYFFSLIESRENAGYWHEGLFSCKWIYWKEIISSSIFPWNKTRSVYTGIWPKFNPFFPVRNYYSFIKYMNVIYSLKGNPIFLQNIFCGLIP